MEAQDRHRDPNSTCNHFETIDNIREQELVLFEAYIQFREGAGRNMKDAGKAEVVRRMVRHFYDLEGLSEEEKKLFKDPETLKHLLTMPWVRIVKEEEREEIGDLAFADSKNEEPDEVFRQIKNLEVRQAVKDMYQLYLDAQHKPDRIAAEEVEAKIKSP